MADNLNTKYTSAVEAIKTAILQGQYEAAKGVNRIQLAVYFGIGKYISLNTRKGVWGTGALKIISDRLQKELPGLRGFSENSLKNMRKFYEEWQMLDANSTIAIVELQSTNNQIDVCFKIINAPKYKKNINHTSADNPSSCLSSKILAGRPSNCPRRGGRRRAFPRCAS